MRSTLKRGAMVVAALAITTLGLVTPATAASAAGPVTPAASSDCPSQYVCLWATTNFTGSRWQGKNNNTTLPSWIDAKSDTLYNNGVNCDAYLFTGTSYTGDGWTFSRGWEYYLADYGLANKFRSQKWYCSLAAGASTAGAAPSLR